MPEARAIYTVERQGLAAWVEGMLSAGVCVFAPRATGEGLVVLGRLARAEELVLEFTTTRNSIREVFMPRSEPLFRFVRNEQGLELCPAPPPKGRAVAFAVRPCDVAALAVTDKVFLDEPADELYRARREATAIVCLFCQSAQPTCLCGAVGGVAERALELSDVALTPVGEGLVAEVLSEKGEELAQLAREALRPAGADEARAAEQARAQIEQQTRERGPLEALSAGVLDLWDSPVWEKHAARCLACGICTYLCPVCQCFDILDAGVMSGTRYRSWDTCQFRYFTVHASGHNPRPNQAARLRQRILHKFKYQPELLGLLGCTGCGRCVALCPVGIAHVDILEELAAKASSGGE